MLDHLEKLLSIQDVEQLWELHCKLMSHYGFDRLIYAFTPFRTGSGLGRLEDTLILSNHDEAYLNEFLRGGLFMHAPMVRWTAENVGACSWGWVGERVRAGLLTPQELHVKFQSFSFRKWQTPSPEERRRIAFAKRSDQAPAMVLATSAAKSSSFFSMPSPTAMRS